MAGPRSGNKKRSTGPPSRKRSAVSSPPRAAKRVTAKSAAVDVLRRAHGPLHQTEIASRVLATTGVKLKGKTPAATIASMLSTENSKPDGLFKRVDKATYELHRKNAEKAAARAAAA